MDAKRLLIFALLLALGHQRNAAAAQPNGGPCALLTAAQVSAAVGTQVAAGAPLGSAGCAWTSASITTSLSLFDATNWALMKSPVPRISKTATAGLGDDAFFSVLGSATGVPTFASLTVRKDQTAYVFKVYAKARSVTEQMAMEKSLAASMLAKH